MKLNAILEEEKYDIEIRREGRRVFAKVDDREYDLEVSEPEKGVFLFKHDGRVHELYVSPPDSANAAYKVTTSGREMEVTVIDPRRLRGVGSIGADQDGVVEIRSAMPGKVVRVVAAVGTEVEKGDGVIVVEAMKMQNELKSPKQGVVREIRVAEGSTVNSGDVLAVIE